MRTGRDLILLVFFLAGFVIGKWANVWMAPPLPTNEQVWRGFAMNMKEQTDADISVLKDDMESLDYRFKEMKQREK